MGKKWVKGAASKLQKKREFLKGENLKRGESFNRKKGR